MSEKETFYNARLVDLNRLWERAYNKITYWNLKKI